MSQVSVRLYGEGLIIETFGRELEAKGRATATIARRLCTITGFYRYAEEEGLIAHSPAVHVRRPRIDYESHAIGRLTHRRGRRTLVQDGGARFLIGGFRPPTRRPHPVPTVRRSNLVSL
jgi:integrase